MKLLNEINNNDYDNNSEELITYQFLYSLRHNDARNMTHSLLFASFPDFWKIDSFSENIFECL